MNVCGHLGEGEGEKEREMAFIQHLPEIWASFRGKIGDDVMHWCSDMIR